jgi:hypothetical protein
MFDQEEIVTDCDLALILPITKVRQYNANMSTERDIAMWTSNIMLDYAVDKIIQADELPRLVKKHGLANFLIDNYELFHLYPDEAVFDEIDKEIARTADV